MMKATMQTAPLMPSAVANDLPVTAVAQAEQQQQGSRSGSVLLATLQRPLDGTGCWQKLLLDMQVGVGALCTGV